MREMRRDYGRETTSSFSDPPQPRPRAIGNFVGRWVGLWMEIITLYINLL